MKGEDLRIRAKAKLVLQGTCPICGEFVYESDDLVCISYRQNHIKQHTFFHAACMKEAREQIRRV